MVKTYLLDGDKGGVGKSFAARCLVDSFLNHTVTGMPEITKIIIIDADPMNPDVVSEDGYKTETVNGIEILAIQHPIKSEGDWVDITNTLEKLILNSQDQIRVVFSLPSAAGLYINETVMSTLKAFNSRIIWVMGTDASSTNQLEDRVNNSPNYYENGYILINLKHGTHKSFDYWYQSDVRKTLLSEDAYKWKEIDLPPMISRAAELIGSKPFHQIVETGSVLGTEIGIGTRTAAQIYRGIAGKKLAEMEKV